MSRVELSWQNTHPVEVQSVYILPFKKSLLVCLFCFLFKLNLCVINVYINDNIVCRFVFKLYNFKC